MALSNVFLNGQIIPSSEAKISINDHGFLYGDGIYETLRTYHGKIWQVHEHLKRLRQSATLLSLEIPYKDEEIMEWLEQLLQRNGFEDSRIRITVTRGINNFDFVSCKAPTFLIQVGQLIPEPPDIYKNGVKIITMPLQRILPEIKSISLLPFIAARQQMAKMNVYEAIFVDESGVISEGTITNVFMIKNGVLQTPGENILWGTTRELILQMARDKNIPLKIETITVKQLMDADEIFITNAPRGIVPVQSVNEQAIQQVPGAITTILMQELQQRIQQLRK